MNLIVDIGNSRIKVGIFENENLRQTQQFAQLDDLNEFLQRKIFHNALISSVSIPAEEAGKRVRVTGQVLFPRPGIHLPIVNTYATPNTLGVDRLAAACGAWSMFPNQASLVIDIGTCINYELVSEQGHYLGGAISPGIRMRLRAMHRETARLPEVSYNTEQRVEAIGTDTISCMQSGAVFGILGEIDGFIERYRQLTSPGLRVILAGGDSAFFENHLKPSIFVAPDVVLMGLNSILLHNVAQ